MILGYWRYPSEKMAKKSGFGSVKTVILVENQPSICYNPLYIFSGMSDLCRADKEELHEKNIHWDKTLISGSFSAAEWTVQR